MNRISIQFSLLIASIFSAGIHAQAVYTPQAPSSPRPAVVDPTKRDPEPVGEKVVEALRKTEGVPEQDIAVSNEGGTIVLTGEVDTAAEDVRATSAAKAAAEGTRVNSAIEVRTPVERKLLQQKAMQLVHDVERALRNDNRTAALGLTVSSEKEGVVILHGRVTSGESRSAAQSVASGVMGVVGVESRMVIPRE